MKMSNADKFEEYTEGLIAYISNYISDFSKEEQDAIKELLHFSSYNKGDFIYKQGEIPKIACFLMTGAVRFFYITEDGKDHTTSFAFESQPVIPYGSFVEQVPSGISIVALEPVEMIWSSREEFNNFVEKHPRFQAGIAKLLSEYLLKGSQQLSLLRIGSSRDRYEKLRTMQSEVINRVPLTHIASYLDMALETLSRVRAGKL
jgi:CRP-like cAMP-binding protein